MAMPADHTSTAPIVLLVSESDDVLIQQTVTALSTSGATLERATDVYNAMARLKEDEARDIRMVLLDPRASDGLEARFFSLLNRYFPSAASAVLASPNRSWTSLANRDPATVGYSFQYLTPEQAADKVQRLRPIPVARPVSEQPPPPVFVAPPSPGVIPPEKVAAPQDEPATDATTDDNQTAYEAVRARMTHGANAPTPRRTPPGGSPRTHLDDEARGVSKRHSLESPVDPIEIDLLLQPPDEAEEEPPL
jgi:hypothetical protein